MLVNVLVDTIEGRIVAKRCEVAVDTREYHPLSSRVIEHSIVACITTCKQLIGDVREVAPRDPIGA